MMDIAELRAFILKRQEQRLRLLVRLYEETRASRRPSPAASLYTLCGGIVDQDELKEFLVYFVNEGLVTGSGLASLALTHKGIVEVEAAITRPRHGTEHFARAVVMHFHGNVGAVQTGASAAASVDQD